MRLGINILIYFKAYIDDLNGIGSLRNLKYNLECVIKTEWNIANQTKNIFKYEITQVSCNFLLDKGGLSELLEVDKITVDAVEFASSSSFSLELK